MVPPVFEWLCCVCSQTRLGHGPRHRGRQVQGVGKVAFRPAAGRRKRIPGAARSFFHRLARARSGAPQQVWFPCRARSAGDCVGCCSCRRGLPTLLQAISEWDLGSGRCRLDCSRRTQKLRRPRSRPAERGTGCSNEQLRHPSHTLSFLRHGQIYQSDLLMLQDGGEAFRPRPPLPSSR